MCVDPASLAAVSQALSATMTAASAVMGVVGSVNEVNQQNEAYTNNIQMANEAAIRDYDAVLSRASEDNANAARQRQELWQQGMRVQGTALASSQNEGNSENAVITDLARQIGQKYSVIDANQKIRDQQVLSNLEGVNAQWRNRVRSVAPGDNSKILASVISGLGKVADYGVTVNQNADKYDSTWMGYAPGSPGYEAPDSMLFGYNPHTKSLVNRRSVRSAIGYGGTM